MCKTETSVCGIRHRWRSKTLSPVHTTIEEFKNVTITRHFGFVFEENSVREITWLSWGNSFRKTPFSKYFQSTLKKTKSRLFKLPPVWRTFSKSSAFRDRLMWTVNLTTEIIKAAFSNFSSAVWTLPQTSKNGKLRKFSRKKIFEQYESFPTFQCFKRQARNSVH